MNSSWLSIRFHAVPISFRLNSSLPKLAIILSIITMAAIALSVSHGQYLVPFPDIIKALIGAETSNPDYAFIVNQLRLPRSLTAWLVGVSLGIAGTITQGILRNPLAAPGIIGINSGASLAAVLLIVVVPGVSSALIPVASFLGGFIVFTLIYLIAWSGGSSPMRLVLIGIGFSLLTGAVTSILVTFGNINSVSQALIWLTGSVYGRGWDEIAAMVPWLIISIPIALLMARDLNVLNLGDDIARSVGSPLEWRRGALLVVSVALAGASVATAGTIGFVGFIAPHIARQLVGASHEGLIIASALMGGLLVLIADLLGRSLFAPIELPCGLVTSIIGAPYFLYLLIRQR